MQTKVDVAERASTLAPPLVTTAVGERDESILTRVGVLAKHGVDFVVVLSGVIILAPVLGLVAALIKWDSPGPVFFRQKRVGRDGKLFEIFKFRTMVDGAYLMGSRLTVKRDPRITRLGHILRWSKIDELPQLFNVLRGEMSLIGPRPEDPHFVEFYSPVQRRVLSVRPGIVGPSQILGRDEVEDYPEGLKDTERYYVEHILPGKLDRDLEYVDRATFWGDMLLLVRGIWMTARGAFRLRYLWRRRQRIALMSLDVALAVASYALACLIRLDWNWPAGGHAWQAMTLIALVRPPLLVYFGAYQGIPRYFGLWDLLALFKAVSAGSLAVAALTYFIGLQSHPRSVFVIDWVLLLFLLSGSRFLLRGWSRWHPRRVSRARHKAIIVGAGSAAEQISRALIEDPAAEYEPVGFVDESHERWGSRIHGVKVLGGIPELRLALSANGVRVVFVCMSDLRTATAREAAEICAGAGVDCRMLPGLSELLNTDGFTVEQSAVQRPRLVRRAGAAKRKKR
jgi:lipopolysaccharide/colanic/teichoic acid biosynthesis glycosyltransferase